MSLHPFPYPNVASDDGDSDTESDRYTEMSLDLSVASSRTSVDFSMRSASPVPSVVSVTSSVRAQAYRQEFGRDLNNYSEVYRLPADDEELARLDQQHMMFCKVMGKYPPPLPQVMAEDNFETKAVLDLGCGSGCWIMDIAREFPHCSAVAVDLVPMQAASMPENLRSEVDDINLGLEHFFGDFNVVHCQLISSGIRDYRALINQISEVLRPGGLIDITEFPFFVAGYDRQPIRLTGAFEPPWTPLCMFHIKQAIVERGGDADASVHLHEWVSSNEAFENVQYRSFWYPCSPWMRGNDPQTRFWNEIGTTMRDDLKAFFKSARPLLLGHGLSLEFVDALEHNACQELDDAVTPVYVLLENVYACKRQ